MTGDDQAHLVYALLWLVLVASALVARRIPWRNTMRMALAWAAIFALVFVLVAMRGRFVDLWTQLRLAANPQQGQIIGQEFRIPMASDGHFRVRALVNGVPVSFLIDSGATITAISDMSVKASGLTIDPDGFGMAIDTANGTVIAHRVRIARLAVGPIVRDDFSAITAPEFGEVNVLGMNFLSTLRRWSVEGNILILSP